jgi:hypothetical protein
MNLNTKNVIVAANLVIQAVGLVAQAAELLRSVDGRRLTLPPGPKL